jgi:hypothetical protein
MVEPTSLRRYFRQPASSAADWDSEWFEPIKKQKQKKHCQWIYRLQQVGSLVCTYFKK